MNKPSIVLETLIAFIARLCGENFYGSLMIEIKNGQIVQIDKKESFIKL